MSTIETIRLAIRNAKTTVERALPELGYNDLVAVCDDAGQFFALLSDALHARRIPDPLPPQNVGPEPPADDPQITVTEPPPEAEPTDPAPAADPAQTPAA